MTHKMRNTIEALKNKPAERGSFRKRLLLNWRMKQRSSHQDLTAFLLPKKQLTISKKRLKLQLNEQQSSHRDGHRRLGTMLNPCHKLQSCRKKKLYS